jgi:hypothetical protein
MMIRTKKELTRSAWAIFSNRNRGEKTMKRRALLIAGLLAALGCLQTSIAGQRGFTDLQAPAAVSPHGPRIHTDFGKIPLQFLPNKGQVDGPAVFYVPGKDKTIYFAVGGLTYVLHGQQESTPERWVVKLDFVGSNPEAVPTSVEESGAVISYFKGKPDAWQTGLSASSRIIYRELWPGIDLVYQGTFDRLKYEFVVRPGADPARIKLAVRGAETFGHTADGRLKIQTPAGGFEDDAPVAYQEIGGVRREVPVSYDLDAKRYGFSVGSFDPGQTLVIDPSTLIYCGFIGGGGDDRGHAIAVDREGCAYIAGLTASPSLPVTVGPDPTSNGSVDAFVAKVNAEGTGLVYCGFLGGSDDDSGHGVGVDASGNAYVAGRTRSSHATFPVFIGPDLTYNSGTMATYGDAFVAKVGASGTSLEYCGYIGGADEDFAHGIAVDAAGNAFVVGTTQSTHATFPVAVGPDLSHNTGSDAFIAKVDPTGARLVYCGYIGGNGGDGGYGVALDTSGCAYVTGGVYPTLDDQDQPRLPLFPAAGGPDLTWNGAGDAFVAKVAANGSSLLYCGYIGGSSSERGLGIAVDGAGCAYVTGETLSTEATFPVKVGPDLIYHPREGSEGGWADAFLAKVDAAGTGLVYCGYIGGSEDDFGYGVAVDASGSAYVTGETHSDQTSFPVLNWPYRKAGGSWDAFVTKVLPSGAGLAYSGFIGGGGTDGGRGIAVDAAGCAYITGTTNSHDLPTVVGPDLIWHISEDVLVAKVPAIPVVYGPEITSLSPSSIAVFDPDFTLNVLGTGFVEGSLINFNYETIAETVYISPTQLQALVPGNFHSGGGIPVVVYNPGVEVSHEAFLNVINPVPALDSIEPTLVTGGYGGTLNISGSNFVDTAIGRLNGQDVNSGISWIGSGYISVPADRVSHSGNVSVTVFNPPPGGGTSNALTLTVTGFTLSATPNPATVTAGKTAIYTIQVTPEFGPFNNSITFTRGDLPRGCGASFNPRVLTPVASPGTITLTVTTKADSGSAAGALSGASPVGPLAAGVFVLLWGLWPRIFARGAFVLTRGRRWMLASAALVLFLMVSGCGTDGGGGNNNPTGTPKGTYAVTINATSGAMTVPLTVTLVVN